MVTLTYIEICRPCILECATVLVFVLSWVLDKSRYNMYNTHHVPVDS